MDTLELILKIIVAASLLNVWLIQYNKNTQWRGGDAKTIKQEFKVYGLPVWMCFVVGFLKVALSIMLIASIWMPELEAVAALGLAFLLLGSIVMHIKISDPIKKSFPAALFLSMCIAIYVI